MTYYWHNPDAVAAELVRSWGLAPPVTITAPYRHGATGEVWLATDAGGDQVLAKLTFDHRSRVEAALRAAEIVDEAGIPSGRPRRTSRGDLLVMVDTVRDEQHPLAALEIVDGTAPDVTDPLVARRMGDLLGRVQAALAALDLPPYDGFLPYLQDEDHEIAFPEKIWPAVRQALAAARVEDLTWGVAYGDGPELRLTESGELALIDWGCAGRYPLVWDVACWIRGFGEASAAANAFLAGFIDSPSPVPRAELKCVDALRRLRVAHLARFFAWRVVRAEHSAATHDDDVRSLRHLTAELGIDLTA